MSRGLIVAVVALLAACTSPGVTESATPPQYTSASHERWDRASKFRPLTASERPAAQAECDARGFGKALGHHGHGLDENGSPIGAYAVLCQDKPPVASRGEKA